MPTPIPHFVAATFGDWTHYYHLGDDTVYPEHRYNDLHQGHCVLPLRKVARPVHLQDVPANPHQACLDLLRANDAADYPDHEDGDLLAAEANLT